MNIHDYAKKHGYKENKDARSFRSVPPKEAEGKLVDIILRGRLIDNPDGFEVQARQNPREWDWQQQSGVEIAYWRISAVAVPEKEVPMHVNDWLDKVGHGYSHGEMMARIFLELFLFPAWKKSNYAPFLAGFKVFCTYKGKKMRLTGASRMGDVWLAHDLNREHGYDLRVNVEDCTEWEGWHGGCHE